MEPLDKLYFIPPVRDRAWQISLSFADQGTAFLRKNRLVADSRLVRNLPRRSAYFERVARLHARRASRVICGRGIPFHPAIGKPTPSGGGLVFILGPCIFGAPLGPSNCCCSSQGFYLKPVDGSNSICSRNQLSPPAPRVTLHPVATPCHGTKLPTRPSSPQFGVTFRHDYAPSAFGRFPCALPRSGVGRCRPTQTYGATADPHRHQRFVVRRPKRGRAANTCQPAPAFRIRTGHHVVYDRQSDDVIRSIHVAAR